MKDFIKIMFASMLGFFIMIVILFFVSLGMITSMMSMMEREKIDLTENTLLHIKLDQAILDRAPAEPFSGFNFATMQPEKKLGLNDILKNLDKAIFIQISD